MEPRKKNFTYEDQDVYVRIFLRSPNQMQAFYEGREFSKAAIEKVLQTCNVTVIIKNKTNDILWLKLDSWEFRSNETVIQRLDRQYWAKQWEEVNLKQAHRSTYGWTLLPEIRNLLPEEGVGGSVTIPKQMGNFSLTLNFPTSESAKGPIKSVTIKELFCAENTDVD